MFTLRDMLVVIILLATTLAIAAHACRPSSCGHPRVRCANNLAQLYKMQANYRAQFGHGDLPVETGGDFWLKLNRVSPPLIDDSLGQIFHCPAHERRRPCRFACDYRGPPVDANTVADGDPLGADRIGNHPEGGNVLRISGDVVFAPADDPLWIRAASHTKP